jgi:integrase
LAQEEGKLKAAPVIRLLKEPPARQGILPEGKIAELLKNLPATLRRLICFLYWSGVRMAEALAIDWEQVDLPSGFIYLREGKTKNDEPRIIPVPTEVDAFLRDIEPKTGRVFAATNLRKAWQAACVASGLGKHTPVKGKPYDPHCEGLNVHDLRRTALTELTRSGVHMFVAMRISGHKDASVFQRYNIVNTQDLAAAMRLREQLSLTSATAKRVKNSVKTLI